MQTRPSSAAPFTLPLYLVTNPFKYLYCLLLIHLADYLLSREDPASEVFVTGTFDQWSKSVKLQKEGAVFQKSLDLPSTDQSYYYKFVVDGEWTTDKTAPTENDHLGNTNNVLRPDQIKPHSHTSASPHSAIMSSVGPDSTTAALAGQVPLEKDKKQASDVDHMPGAFPAETPQNETRGFVGHDRPELAPGDIVPNYGSAGRSATKSGAPQAKSPKDGEQTFGVSPLPATAGADNPIKTKPGESLPSSTSYIPGKDISSQVKTDKESYERSDAYPTSGSAMHDSQGAFGVPPVTQNMIPESSLPIGQPSSGSRNNSGHYMQSAGAGSSTAAMVGQVPLESRGVPQIVSDSQHQANASPEPSKSPDTVMDKKEVEHEIKDKVPEQPPTSENRTSKSTATAAAGGAAVVGGSAAAASGIPSSIQNAISGMNAKSDTSPSQTAPGVPETVSDAQAATQTSPEAASNPQAISNKKAVEAELHDKVSPSQQTGESAPAFAVARFTVPASMHEENSFGVDQLTHQVGHTEGAPMIADEDTLPAIAVANANAGAESTENGSAAQSSIGTATKGDPADTTSGQTGSGGASLNAPASQPAQSAVTEAKAATETSGEEAKAPAGPFAPKKDRNFADDAREVSPMSKPTVTTGTSSGHTPLKSSATDASSSTASSPTDFKKKNRRSFFGKIKDKLK